MYTSLELTRIVAIERRIRHLDARVLNTDKDLSFDRQESAALKWILSELRMSRGEWTEAERYVKETERRR